jgi:hypothetical protein
MHPLSSSCTVLLAAVLALSAGARADETEPGSSAQPGQLPIQPAQWSPAALQAAVPAPQPDSLFGLAADDELLDSARGGSDLTKIDTTLTGTVSANSASNVVTGSNVIQGGSFANMSGIPIIVQNTGANVLIQNATVINLQFK